MNELRIATVPDTHPYIAAIQPDSVEHHRLTSVGATAWERSPLLDASRVDHLLAGTDVVHVHFGYEGLAPAQLGRFINAVRRSGQALVVTVHDLRNPHDADPAQHLVHLEMLVAAADGVLTLTPGAAAEIQQRWSRVATVVPHPTLMVSSVLERLPRRRSRPVVGIHLKSLRRNVREPLRLVTAAAHGARDMGAVLRVDVHDPGADPAVLGELNRYADAGLIDLRRHERFSDDELLVYLPDLDVSVLPYQFGSHSGWLEMCRDLGVGIVAPDCGFYAEQWDRVTTYRNNERAGLDEASLRRAVRDAIHAGPPAPADRRLRLAQLREVRATHARMYRHAVVRARQTPVSSS